MANKNIRKYSALVSFQTLITVEVEAETQAEAIEKALAIASERSEDKDIIKEHGSMSLVSICSENKKGTALDVFVPKPGGAYSDL